MSTGFKLLCETTLFRSRRQMVVDQGAISTEDVVIASFLEGWPRRKGDRLSGSWRGIEGRGRAGLGRAQLKKAHRLAELAERVGNLWYDGP